MSKKYAALLRTLHDEHAPALRRFVIRLTGDAQLANDVVQETLLRAWRSPGQLSDNQSSPRAWLFTVARNLVIDEQRSARSRREIPSDELPERAIVDDTDAILDSWLVADALAQLSPEHRTVIVYAYYGRRSVPDIATELGVPAGTVKSRLHYGLRSLQLALQEKGVTKR